MSRFDQSKPSRGRSRQGPPSDGMFEFKMREEFTGLRAPLITKSIPDPQPTFDEFAACLKKKAESAK